MNRRSFLRGVASAVPAGAVVNEIVAEPRNSSAESYEILGRYLMLSPQKKASFREQMRDLGNSEMADALERFA